MVSASRIKNHRRRQFLNFTLHSPNFTLFRSSPNFTKPPYKICMNHHFPIAFAGNLCNNKLDNL